MEYKQIHKNLLDWFAQNKRVLPWRKNKDPYRIWISEIMLQQTRVEAAIPYYEKFLARFPNVAALAHAHEDEVRAHWAGLGYYSRAVNLHKAAQQIMRNFLGKFPITYEDLLELPGIGPYTAAAISSIAFTEKRAAIDGNLERVLSRVLALRDDVKSGIGQAAIQKISSALVNLGNADDVNEALMDLSSIVCAVKNPRCLVCPLQTHCLASAKGLTDFIPAKREKPKPIQLNSKALLIFYKNKKVTELLLLRRQKEEWLSGMWDIPWWIENKEKNNLIHITKKIVLQKFGKSEGKRTITKHKITIHNEFYLLKNKKSLETFLDKQNIPYQWQKAKEAKLPRPSLTALSSALKQLEISN